MGDYIDISAIAERGRLGTKLARDLVPGDIILVPHPWNNRRRQQFKLERVVEPSQMRLDIMTGRTREDEAWFDTVSLEGGHRGRSNVLTDADHAYRTLELDPTLSRAIAQSTP